MNRTADLPPPYAEERFDAGALRLARAAASAGGGNLIDLLQQQAGLDDASFLARLAATVQLPAFDLDDLEGLAPDFEALPYTEALQRECLPLRKRDGQLLIVVANPFDAAMRDWVEFYFNGRARMALARAVDIVASLARHEGGRLAMDDEMTALPSEVTTVTEDLSLKRISEDSSPVVRLVNSTLYDALRLGASDIHLEMSPAALLVKYRIDGVLSAMGTIPGVAKAEQAISRIKVLAELDIAERRVPQDGRFKVGLQGREIDFRVSIMPSMHGEDAVLRILDKQSLADPLGGLRLDSLGFNDATKTELRRLSREPYGMLLVTGPTGSGKTSTLYAALAEINNGRDKIVTIEDPVEYELPGVLQIPVNEKKGLTFARGLRSILRHDPDKIMVGEIRDGETAQIAIQAALTGHLVFTTVHANNVFDVIGRFMHMGVDPYNLVSALNAVVAQRLVRINCPQCSEPFEPDAGLLAESGIADALGYPHKLRAGRGCSHCNGSGYKGRRAIAELLILNDELRELIIGREPLRRIKEVARRGGTRSLREAGMELVLQGETSLEELNRVTFVA
jgi:general secretion pathway protein E